MSEEPLYYFVNILNRSPTLNLKNPLLLTKFLLLNTHELVQNTCKDKRLVSCISHCPECKE